MKRLSNWNWPCGLYLAFWAVVFVVGVAAVVTAWR